MNDSIVIREGAETADMPEQDPPPAVDNEALALFLEAITEEPVSEATPKPKLNIVEKSLIPEEFLLSEDDSTGKMNKLRTSLQQTEERNKLLISAAIDSIQLQATPEELALEPDVDRLYTTYESYRLEIPQDADTTRDLKDTNVLILQATVKITELESELQILDEEQQELGGEDEIKASIDQLNGIIDLKEHATEEETKTLNELYDKWNRHYELKFAKLAKAREIQKFNYRKNKLDFIRQKLIVSTEGDVTRNVIRNGNDNLKEIISDGFLIKTIRQKYIQDHVLGEIESAFNDGIMSENEIRGMFNLLNDYVKNVDGQNAIERTAQEVELKRLFSKHTNLKKTELFFHIIKEGWDGSAISILTKQTSMNQIKELQGRVDEQVEGERLRDLLSTNREVRNLFKESWSNTQLYHAYLPFKMQDLYVHDNTLSVPFTSIWQTTRETLQANDLMATELSQIDEKLQHNIIVEILDGKTHSLRELEYFYSPQVIRILFILSTSNKDFFSSGESFRMLSQIYESDRWNEVRDNAISMYPNLKGCIELFESKNQESNPNNVIIKNLLRSELATELIDIIQNPDDKKYARLASQSLGLESLLNVLIDNGKVHINSVPHIKLIIEGLNSQNRAMLEDPSIIEDDLSKFKFHQALVEALSNQVLDEQNVDNSVLAKFEAISKFINIELKDVEIDSKTIFSVFSGKALGFDNEVELLTFLDTIRTHPVLLSNQSLFENYCTLYKTESSLQYVQLLEDWKDKPEDLGAIYKAVEYGYIRAEEALTLNDKIGKLNLGTVALNLSLEFPELFIRETEGVELLQKLVIDGIDNIGHDNDVLLGKYLISIKRAENIRFNRFIDLLIQIDIQQINSLLDQPDKGRKDLNWKQAFLAQGIIATGVVDDNFKLSPTALKKLEGLVSEDGLNDNHLRYLRDEYLDLLENGDLANPTGSLMRSTEILPILAEQINLTQIATLGSFVRAITVNSAIETTSPRTTREIQQGLLIMEGKMKEAKWANLEKSYFYDISKKILDTSPSLFSSYLELMHSMSKNELKTFVKEVYPLFNTKLILLQSDSEPDHIRNLVIIREDVRSFHSALAKGETDGEQKRQQLTAEIVGLVRERYGIKDLPETLTSVQYRSINNFAMYLTNMEGRTELKENILALYLALTLKGEWKQLRSGNNINPQVLLKEDKALTLEPVVRSQEIVNSRIYGILGVEAESRERFQAILQSDEMVRSEGMVQTTDVKLMNLISNLRIFDDPDIFSDELDLVRYNLLGKYGDKTLNKSVAMIYRSLLNGSVTLGEEEQQIQTEIEAILKKSNLEFTPENVKRYFQQGLIPFVNIYKIKQTIVEGDVERRIEDLRQSLLPPSKIIDIFSKLGEDFRPQSGAMALTQDVSFLENLVVKKEDDLTQEELDEISNYLAPIREQLIELEEINVILAGKTKPYNDTDDSVRGDLLKTQIKMIDEIVKSKNEIEPLVSTSTNDLNTIIENLRACLSCKTAEINNSTNLTFGESYKFYLYTAAASQSEGSIADQIVYFVPVKKSGEEDEMSFVFDQVYGSSTPLILSNHVNTIIAKMTKLREAFPDMKLSIFIPKNTLTSVGTSAEILKDQYLTSDLTVSDESLTVDIPQSEFGDHYVEFGGEAREPGQREVQGVMLRML